MKKRVLSMLMALALCLTLLPVPAWAEEADAHTQTGTDDAVYALDADAVVQSTENGDANTVENAVAEVTASDGTLIGRYTSLSEAVTAAKSSTGSTVTLLANTTVTEWMSISRGTFTIDLNQHTVTVTSQRCFSIDGSAEITIENGTLAGTGDDNTDVVRVMIGAKVTLKDVTATAGGAYPVNVMNGNVTVYIYGGECGTAETESGIYVSAGATVKLYGGIYHAIWTRDNDLDYSALLPAGYVFLQWENSGSDYTKYIDPSDMGTETDKEPNIHNIQVTKCTHSGGYDANGNCVRCGLPHEHVLGNDGKCVSCGQQIAAQVGDSYYSTLAAAIETAKNNGTVTLLANVEEDITIADGTDVTIDLNKTTWIGYGTGWAGYQPVPLTVNGGSVTLKNGTLNQGGASDNANTAVIVNGGSLTVGEGMTIRGAVYASGEYRPAIEVQDGQLTLSVGTKLIYGMKVSVENKTLADYLPEGTAFVQIPDDGAGSFVNGYVQELTGNFTLSVEKHTHFVGADSTCACGFVCKHPSLGFTNGVCGTCGYHCPHIAVMTDPWNNVSCAACYAQMVAKVTTDNDITTYYAEHHEARYPYAEDTLKQVFNEAETGSTVTLLADGLYASGWAEGKELTLNLNGKNVIENNGFVVESKDGTAGKLIVTGSGSSETPGSYLCTFRVWNGELLFDDNFSGTFGTIYVHGGTLTSASTNSEAIHIDTLNITNSGATISLKGGTFGKICFTALGGGSVTLGDLLAEKNPIQKSGKAFKYTGEDGAFVEYNTVIDNSNAVENVTITDCPHNSITDGENGGACSTCGMKDIAAVLTDANSGIKTCTINDSTDDMFKVLTSNGGTLKLYRDLTFNGYLGQEGGTTEMVIDLNGHEIKLPDEAADQDITLNGGKLTIQDSGTGKKSKFSARLRVYYTAELVVDGVEMGTIGLVSSTASITLKAGTTFTGYEKPYGTMLARWIEDGNCISGLTNSSIDGYSEKSESGEFAVEKVPATFGTPVKSGTIQYNGLMPEEVIPGITPDAGSNVSSVEMRWYYRKSDGGFDTINQNGTIDPNDPEKTWRGYVNSSSIFSKFNIGDTISDVFCVLIAKDGNGKTLWSTVLRGYSFTLANGDLSEATVVPANLDSLVYTPDGYGSCMSQQLQFTVKSNDWTTLTEGTDYQVKDDSSLAYNAGEYTLVLEGMGKYVGSTLEYKWKVKQRELTGMTDLSKSYDGTTDLLDDIFFTYDGGSVLLSKYNGRDFTMTGGYDSADAGERTVTATVTLTNPNYTFADGKTQQTFTIDSVSIHKASANELTKQSGTLNIVNNHAATYTYDVSALLPKLETGKRFGEITYTGTWSSTVSGYVTEALTIDSNGVLHLPVNAVDRTEEKRVGYVMVTVASENYLDFTMRIDINAVNKIIPTGAPVLSRNELTYGDKLSSIALSGTMKDGETTVAGTFAWTQPDAVLNAGDAVSAEWKFTPAESSRYMEVTGTATITVHKATPTGAPKYTAITQSGRKLSDAALTVEGGTFSVPGTVKWVDANGADLSGDTEVKANTSYEWVFTPADKANYNEISGSVTLYSVSSSGGGGGSSTTTTKTETTTNPDGSVTKTETKSDGTVIETTTNKDGSTSKTETKKDGSSKTEIKDANGSTGTVNTDKNGNTTAEAKITDKAISDAKKSDEAVKIPTEVTPGEDSASAPTVKIDLPSSAGETKIEIPVKGATGGTVAIIVKPDGTEEIVKDSVPTENGIQLTVDGDVTVKLVDNAKGFTDIGGHWAEDSIDFVSARGLVNGTSESTFSPDAPTTRAQLWTILARQANADLTGGASWYEKAQAWAKESGISDGFNPDGTITRAQMVTMLWRAAGSPEVTAETVFTDVPAGSYYAKAVAWAVERGITTGVGNGKFAPDDACTRAQVAAFLHRSY